MLLEVIFLSSVACQPYLLCFSLLPFYSECQMPQNRLKLSMCASSCLLAAHIPFTFWRCMVLCVPFSFKLKQVPQISQSFQKASSSRKKMSKNGKLVLKILLSDGFPAKPARVTLLWVVSQQLGIIFMAYGLTGSPSTVFSWFVPGTLRTISALLCRNSDVGLYDSGSLACDKYNFFSFPSL